MTASPVITDVINLGTPTPTVLGTADVTTTVNIFIDDTLTASFSVASDGSWSYTTDPLGEGAHNVTATASDTSGVESDPISHDFTIDFSFSDYVPDDPDAPVLVANRCLYDPSDYDFTFRVDRKIVSNTTDIPPDEIIQALESGVVLTTRRVEVYEADGVTLWNPDTENDLEFARLVDGSVSVDATSSERRKLDLVLDNRDKLLHPNPNGGLWYDKIIKVYRGLIYQGTAPIPKAAIIEADSESDGYLLKNILANLGFTNTDYLPNAADITDLQEYSYIFSWNNTAASTKSDLLKDLWNHGKTIVTLGVANTIAEIPIFSSDNYDSAASWGISSKPAWTPWGDTPVVDRYAETDLGTMAGSTPLGVSSGTVALSFWHAGVDDTVVFTAAANMGISGTYWLDLHVPTIQNTEVQNLIRASLNFIRGYYSKIEWEAQIGEFMIDNLSSDYFPDQVKITGRDYTKKLLLSKITTSVTFEAGTSLKDYVRAIAINGGINPKKLRIGVQDEQLTSDISFDRGTDRWTIITQACETFNYEVFFDAMGYLVVRQYIDPQSGPISWTFARGKNLVSYSRSTNDSRIYNHVCVYGDPSSDEERLPYFGEAINDDLQSPTNTTRLGDRLYTFASTFFTDSSQCQDYADQKLKVVALEQYELDVSSIFYPWLEANEIVAIETGEELDFEPTRFLMDTITYPLALGPMSLTGKRVTFVGSSGSPADQVDEEVVA